MAYTTFRNGFNISTSAAIDRRIFLTKAEMRTAETDYNLPSIYFCICPDDGKFYIYNINNPVDNTTGRYRVIDESITFTSEAAKTQLNEAIKNSVKIQEIQTEVDTLSDSVDTLSTNVTNIDGRVTTLEPKVTTLETKVGDEASGLVKRVADAEIDISQVEADIDQAQEDIEDIQTWIDNVKLDGGEIVAKYTLSPILTNVTIEGTGRDIEYKTETEFEFTANSGYTLPATVTVNGTVVGPAVTECSGTKAVWTLESSTQGPYGLLVLTDTTNNVTVTVTGVAEA